MGLPFDGPTHGWAYPFDGRTHGWAYPSGVRHHRKGLSYLAVVPRTLIILVTVNLAICQRLKPKDIVIYVYAFCPIDQFVLIIVDFMFL